MVKITTPITCKKCNNPMDNYSIDRTNQRLIFNCRCGNVEPIAIKEYEMLLKTGKLRK